MNAWRKRKKIRKGEEKKTRKNERNMKEEKG